MKKNLIGLWYWIGLPLLLLVQHYQVETGMSFCIAWLIMFLLYDFKYHRERERIDQLLKKNNIDATIPPHDDDDSLPID